VVRARNAVQALARATSVPAPSSRARIGSGAVITAARNGFIDSVFCFTTSRRSVCTIRIISTCPSRTLGTTRAWPDAAARAACNASSWSVLPRSRRCCRSGDVTSTTDTPSACR